MTAVSPEARFSSSGHNCPICGGWSKSNPQCKGYEGENSDYIFCTNSDHSGGLPRGDTGFYRHYLKGDCHCGMSHGGVAIQYGRLPILNPVPAANGHKTKSKYGPWKYFTEDGTLDTVVTRFELGNGDKDFLHTHPDESGSFVIGDGPVGKLLYKLPELIASDKNIPVFVVEGEKAVDALREQGFVATCNINGAGKWQANYNYYLSGRKVIIIPDNDPDFDKRGKPFRVGQIHAANIAASLTSIAQVKLMSPLPYVPVKGDAFDWFQMGKTKEELADWTKTVEWKVPAKLFYQIDEYHLIPPVKWLLEPYFIESGLTLTVGESEVGKSFILIHFGLRIATELHRQVIYLGLESFSQYPERVLAWLEFYKLKAQGDFILSPFPLQLMERSSVLALIKEIQGNGWKPAMIIIDTYHAATSGADEISGQDTGVIVENLKLLRDTLKTNVNCVHHLNASGARERGHTSLKAAMDTMLVLKTEGDGVKVECGKQRSAPHFQDRAINWQYIPSAVDPDAPPSRVAQESDQPIKIDFKRAGKNDRKLLQLLGGEAYRNTGLGYMDIHKLLPDVPESSLIASLSKCKKAFWVQGGGKSPSIITNDGLSIIGYDAGPIEDY